MAEIWLPTGLVSQLKHQPGGLNSVLETIRRKHLISAEFDGNVGLRLYGQEEDILQLEKKYLYSLICVTTTTETKSLRENGTVEWRFQEEQAAIIKRLFKSELLDLLNVESVKISSGKVNSEEVVISCHISKYSDMKHPMEKLEAGIRSCGVVTLTVDNKDDKVREFIETNYDSFFCKLRSNKLTFFCRSSCDEAVNIWFEFIGEKHHVQPETSSTINRTRHIIRETEKNVSRNKPDIKQQIVEVDRRQMIHGEKADSSGSSVEKHQPDFLLSSDVLENDQSYRSSGSGDSQIYFKSLANSDVTRIPGAIKTSGGTTMYTFDCSGMTVSVYKASITEIKGIDAITNAANDGLFHGGGLAYDIFKAAGDKMNQECKAYIDKHNRIPVSENFVSNPGKMTCKGIIHAVGPMWCDYQVKEQCAKDLYRTLINVLEVTKKKLWKSVALPAISSGIFGVPKQLCAEMYVKAFVDFVDHGTVTDVHFIAVNQDILDMVIDAHKQWVNNPACLSFKNALQYPVVLSSKTTSRTKRGVSTIIKFVGEDYFFRERRFQYRILDKLTLYVYCGDLLMLDNVDAIVVPLHPDMTGGALAQGIKQLGGTRYKKDLAAFRMMKEGDAFVCPKSGGMKTNVIHVILSPITGTDPKTLAHYSATSGNLFSQVHFQRVALPLVGSGFLNQNARSKLSESLLEGIIDVWTCPEKKIKISELHVVNMEPALTTCLQNELKRMTLGKTETKFSGSGGITSGDGLCGF